LNLFNSSNEFNDDEFDDDDNDEKVIGQTEVESGIGNS